MPSTENTRIRLEVPQGHTDHQRLDVYITQFIQNATRNKVQEGIKNGHVMVNGMPEKVSYRMQPGDVIDIELPKPPPPEAVAENIPLTIIHEDDHIVIVDKDAGMVVHPAYGNWTGTLVNALLHHVDDLNDDEDNLRPGIVHRLDKGTSGLLVVAKNEKALSRLSEQFARHDIRRTYLAVVWGNPDPTGTLTGNIGRSRKDRKIMAVVPDGEGKPAVTHYKVLEYFDHLSLVEVQLETGRTHQIRVHFSHAGYPVFGDQTYGGASVRYGSNTGARKSMFDNLFQSLNRQCLHAKTLGFIHPETQNEVFFESELPGDFRNVLNKLRTFCKN